MPESKGRPKPKNPASERSSGQTRPAAKQAANPSWFVPVMVALMIIGVLWVATFYLTEGAYPVEVGYWNLAIGLGFIMAGFIMSTRWR